MNLLGVQAYIEKCHHKDDRPHPKTVRRWCEKRLLPCVWIGNKPYIDADRINIVTTETDELIKQAIR